MSKNNWIQTYQCSCDEVKNPWRVAVTLDEVKKFGVPKCPNCQMQMTFYETKEMIHPKQYQVLAIKANKIIHLTKMDIDEKGLVSVLWYRDGHHTRWIFTKDIDFLEIKEVE